MKQIHLIIPFSRHENKENLIDAYRGMGVVVHLIMFQDEAVELPSDDFLNPIMISEDSKDCKAKMPGCYKRNWFIKNCDIVDGDYYVTADDDDMYEPGVFDAVRQMDDDIVIISMKRGKNIPVNVDDIRRYPTTTLYAKLENIEIGKISAQQSFVKGKIFKCHLFNEDFHRWDGEIAVHHKEAGEQIAYRPDLFALFNYYEPGRWEGEKFSFGVLVNDVYRLNTVLAKSALPGELHYVFNPESATKGLNQLLDCMEGEGTDIAVLTHQDMYYRNGWLEKVKAQLELLPDSWVVAGIIGKDMEGRMCGKLHDMRIVDIINSSEYHDFPEPACCFDECCIIINMSKEFRFDESLDGFDLYGTLAVLQTWEMGGTAWIIDAFAEHYCMRPFSWWPPDEFKARYKMLYDRFNDKFKSVDSTVFVSRPRFETSAA